LGYGGQSPEAKFDLDHFLLENTQTHQPISPMYLVDRKTFNECRQRTPRPGEKPVVDNILRLDNIV